MKRQQPDSGFEQQSIAMHDTIIESMKIMQQFMFEMKSRMDRLEDNVEKVQGAVGVLSHMQTTTRSPTVSVLTDHSSPSLASLPRLDEPTLSLRVSSEVESMWYTDRPFPSFTVDIVDSTGSVCEAADDWDVAVNLIDGYGRYINDKLGQGERSRRAVAHKGRITAAGLRFFAVSSKNGGHFNLEFEIKSPREFASKITPVKSPNITILSCRLFHNPKAPLNKLGPDDSLSKMPGIGRLYAQRFCAIGIDTIGKLADVNLDNMSTTQQQLFLESLRRDKGTMTKAKLEEYICQARLVMERIGSEPPAPKRQRTEPASFELCDSSDTSSVGNMCIATNTVPAPGAAITTTPSPLVVDEPVVTTKASPSRSFDFGSLDLLCEPNEPPFIVTRERHSSSSVSKYFDVESALTSEPQVHINPMEIVVS